MLPGPSDDVMVEELAAVVEGHSGDLERDHAQGGVQRGQDVGVGVVAHAGGVAPAGVHAREVERLNELSLHRGATVSHGVAFEEPGLGLNLVAGLTDLDRGTQQR